MPDFSTKTLFAVLVDDRHLDLEITAFPTLGKALSHANQVLADYEDPDDLEHYEYPASDRAEGFFLHAYDEVRTWKITVRSFPLVQP